MEELYKEMILDLYRNPLHKGKLDEFDVSGEGVNASCGDDVKMYVKFNQEGRVEKIGHEGQGCAISQAGISLLADHVIGKNKEEILYMIPEDMMDMFGIQITHTRLKCAILGLTTLQKALEEQE